MKLIPLVVLCLITALLSGCGMRRHTTTSPEAIVAAVKQEATVDATRDEVFVLTNPTWEFVSFDADKHVIELLQNTFVNTEKVQYRCFLTLKPATYDNTPTTRISFEAYPAFWGIRYATLNYLLLHSNANVASLCVQKLEKAVPVQEKSLLDKLTN